MKRLTRAHIEAEARLRGWAKASLAQIWAQLPGYDRRNVDEWLSRALPVIAAAQRHSVAVTDAYVAAMKGRGPLGFDPGPILDSLRKGATAAEVYERPFVTLWSALGDGVPYEDAVSSALARATGSAAMDVQLAARGSFDAIDELSDDVFGYERVANATACEFCQTIDGAYVKAADGYAFALHNNCGCSLEPLSEPHPRAVTLPDGTPVRPNQYGALNETVAVHDHGELGAVLGSPDHAFSRA